MKLLWQIGLFLYLFAFIDGVRFRCDYKYTDLGWFKYHEIPATWTDARLRCKLEGAMLASPTTAAIKSLMLGSFCKPEVFTGIHSTVSRGYYTTIDGKPLAEFPHEWATFEPNNQFNDESCLALNSDGTLSDVRCDEPRPYICYRENSQIDVNICGTLDPEYHFESMTNKCYKFHTNPRNFSRANFACSAEGGHLAIINSDTESQIMRNIFARYPKSSIPGVLFKDVAFIGFYDWGEGEDWTTIHGQSLQEAGFNKFAPGQPDHAPASEHCGSIFRNGLLNDNGCELQHAFICEKDPGYPALCDTAEAHNVTQLHRFCDKDLTQSKDQQVVYK